MALYRHQFERLECAFTPPARPECGIYCDVMYGVLYVRVNCFECVDVQSRGKDINVCNSDMFSVVHMYLDHLRFYVVCINGRRYVCCSKCYVVSECDDRSVRLYLTPTV